MSKRKYKRAKKKELNRKRIGILLIAIIIIIYCVYNNMKPQYQATETVNYGQAKKIEKTIVIDPGHGGEEEPGCVFGNVYEKELDLEIAKKLQAKLEKEYSRVIMTRTEDVNVYLNERARIANRENADLFISIHQNALEDDDVTSGIETWYNPVKDTESKILAQNIQENIIKTTNANDLGIKESKGLIVTQKAEMPSCLVETGFLSSTKERQKLAEDDYQDKIVEGIYNGIKAYFEEMENTEDSLEGNNV